MRTTNKQTRRTGHCKTVEFTFDMAEDTAECVAGESSVAEARVGEGEVVDVAGGEGDAVGERLGR